MFSGMFIWGTLLCEGFRLVLFPMTNEFVLAGIQNSVSYHAPLKGKCLTSSVIKSHLTNHRGKITSTVAEVV